MNYERGLHIDPTAHIAPSATVIGDVTVGADCTILFNAVVRGDYEGTIEIGEGTNLQEGVCLHVNRGEVTRLGRGVTVGHGAIVHGCDIGDGTLVGMGSTVIDRARVGKRCLIGAGALVTGTADIPDEMLVIGSPARAVRPLTAEELADLKDAELEYRSIGASLEEQGYLCSGAAYRAQRVQ